MHAVQTMKEAAMAVPKRMTTPVKDRAESCSRNRSAQPALYASGVLRAIRFFPALCHPEPTLAAQASLAAANALTGSRHISTTWRCCDRHRYVGQNKPRGPHVHA